MLPSLLFQKKFRLLYSLPFLVIFTLCFFQLPASSAATATVTVAWDKSPETDVIGYKFYYGTDSKNYQPPVDVKNNTSCTISGLAEGTKYYFAAKAYNDKYIHSNYSDELAYTIPITPPASPADTDGDGLTDDDEINIYGTDPEEADTDGDGINDGDEIDIYGTNPVKEDTDGDGINDGDEIDIYGTNPIKEDTDGDGMNDGDELAFWGDKWDDDSDNDGLVNLVDPDSDNDGYNDGTSPPSSSLPLPTLEIGEISIDHEWTRVIFKKTFTDPVVVAQPISLNDGAPAVIRVRNVDSSGFEIRVQEWDYLDDVHALEKVSFLALDRGSYALKDGTIVEAGSFETDRVGSFGGVTFSQTFQAAPVVVATISSINEADAVTARLRNISNQGFEFCMQEQELNPKDHAEESVNYIAWEPSVGTVDGLPFEVGKTGDILTHVIHSISFSQAYTNAPVFLTNIQTGDGMDTANVRWRNKDTNSIDVKIDEEQSKNDETSHTTEILGYMAIASSDIDEDSDGDGLYDDDEINIYGTDPNNADTDNDGINDGDELAFWGDNWSDDSDNDELMNLIDPDSDGDGYTDGFEVSNGYDPSDPSSHPIEDGLEANFNSGKDGFSFAPDTFNNTVKPAFSTGSYEKTGGDGFLRVFIGPGSTGGATSGGWSRNFSFKQNVIAQVTLSFRLIMDQGYEANEFGEVVLEIDGIRHGNDENDSLVHVIGNGNGGGIDDTGWLTESFTVPLSKGTHMLVIGAYNNNATYSDESVEVLIDDFTIVEVELPSTEPVQPVGSWLSGLSHSVESGVNRVLVFTAHVEDNDGVPNLESVTYGGQTMTKIIEQSVGSSYRAYVVAYILNDDKEAGIPAASNGAFVPTWTEKPDKVAYSSIFFANVDQVEPVGISDSNYTTSLGTLTTTDSLATADGDLVFVAGTCGNTGSYSVNNDFTEGIELTMSSSDAVTGYKQATGTDEIPSITHSNLNRQVVVGFVVQNYNE